MTDTKNFDTLLSQAFTLYVEDTINSEFRDVPEYCPSESFNKRIDCLIKSERNYYYKFTLTRTRRILCACLIMIIILLSLLSVGAVREAITNFFIEVFSNHNSISVKAESGASYPSSIERVYSPEYIPDGYTLIDEDISEAGVSLIYGNDDKMILFTQETKQNYTLNLDNEYATSSVEAIDGQDYYINHFKDGNYTILWDNGEYVFTVTAELPKNDILKMCNSLKIYKQ